ncbi:MFS transporter [Nonomuraea soli]|uniref:MFS transporter n=1 Tax=Nonomuraea soli TaxID=1032476 RepID=A0A7W0CQ10_9ACTN|nr:MFS transporter [Nonomuraea soli]MBA2895251.1 hypothetical protein [Nonomuraea soli]
MADGWEKAGEVSRRVGRGLADAGRATARGARSTARGTASAARSTARGTAAAAKGTARGARRVGQATRRLTHADGADRTGLGRLIELTATHSVGDALVTGALATTIFFGLPVGEARGSVALYLVITMIPFALVAPFVGPILDRFRSGRRYVMAGTLFGRGLLCFAMAAAVGPNDLVTLFASALGVLVLSKAYNVSRAAIMPSVLPADITLVSANARVALFSLIAAGAAVPIAAGLATWLGAAWTLRLAMVVFLMTGVLAVRLPRHVDSPDDTDEESGQVRWRTVLKMGPAVTESMLANIGIRLFSGFLLFFLLFLVQESNVPGMRPAVPPAGVAVDQLTGFAPLALIALLAGAAGLGGLVGALAANWARHHSPLLIILLTSAFTLVITVVTAVFFNVWWALGIAFTIAFAQELGKLAMDAIIQREIGEEVRSSTFGVVEAFLQVAWVFGGLVGLLLSLTESGRAGLIALSVVLGVGLVWLLARRRSRIKARDARAEAEQAPSGVVDVIDTTKPLTRPQ